MPGNLVIECLDYGKDGMIGNSPPLSTEFPTGMAFITPESGIEHGYRWMYRITVSAKSHVYEDELVFEDDSCKQTVT